MLRQDGSAVHTGADFSGAPTQVFCFSLARKVALTRDINLTCASTESSAVMSWVAVQGSAGLPCVSVTLEQSSCLKRKGAICGTSFPRTVLQPKKKISVNSPSLSPGRATVPNLTNPS